MRRNETSVNEHHLGRWKTAVQAAVLGKAVYAEENVYDIPKRTYRCGRHTTVFSMTTILPLHKRSRFTTFTAISLNRELIKSFALKESITKNEITFQVKQVFNQLLYLKSRQQTLLSLDSLLNDLSRAAALQYKTGEGTLLTKDFVKRRGLK
jgi:hypothetical protein